MASPFDRLIQTVLPHLPGAIESAVKLELYGTCLEFFKLSTAWREEIPVTLLSGNSVTDIMPTAGRIQNLLWVKNSDDRAVYKCYLPTPETIHFPFEASADTIYVATCSLTVKDPVTRDAFPIVPYQSVERYMEELEWGLLSRMMAQPMKPYTNVAMARYYTTRFKSGAARAKNELKAGHTEGSQAWVYPQGFSTVR